MDPEAYAVGRRLGIGKQDKVGGLVGSGQGEGFPGVLSYLGGSF